MRNVLGDFLTQLKGIWSRLDGGQRLVVSSVLIATVIGLGAIVWLAGRPSYEVVYTATSPEDLGKVSQSLQQANISFVPDSTGMSFLVDRSVVGAARQAIRGAGLMTQENGGDIGISSIIDDRETKAWKLASASVARAEVAVRDIDGVLKVRITGATPRRTRAFVDKDRETRPTAAVLIQIRSGVSFYDVAPKAMHLTASQLGLPPENITVSNAVGRQTYRYDPDRESGAGSSEFLDLQRKMSEDRTARAQEFLDSMWPGKTSVVVLVELDPEWEVVSEKVLPEVEIKRSEKSTEEVSESTPNVAGSIGAVNGATGLDSESLADKKDKTKNKTTETEYVTEIGERRRGLSAPPIRRLTVAVSYDRVIEVENFDKTELERAVKSMVGWDKDRDSEDAFSLMPSDFPEFDLEELTAAEAGVFDLALQWGPAVGQILGVLVVVLFLRGLFKRSRRSVAARSDEGGGRTEREQQLSPEDQQRLMRREIERAIAEDPAALAKLLESWLIEQGT